MRRIFCSFFVFAAVISAQEVPPQRPISPIGSQLDRMEEGLRLKTAVLRRDAFIVSQIVAAVGQLENFQRNVALERSRDNIQAALKRAGERPPAPRSTSELLQSELDLIAKAKQQAATADISALKREMMKLSHFMQQTLFRELDDARRDRQVITDLQARLSRITNDMDEALSEALGSTFDYFRAGGQ